VKTYSYFVSVATFLQVEVPHSA